jgi:quercetin dioxygenase-like cupin family protein
MAQSGERVSVPGFVDWLEIQESTPDVLRFEISFRPRAVITREHVHPAQAERHDVLSGQLRLRVDGTVHTLTEGQSMVVAPGTPHAVLAGEGPVRMRFELRPALRWGSLIDLAVRLGQQRQRNVRGYVNPLLVALVAMEYRPEVYATRPPLPVQDAVLRPLAAVARRRGYHRRYLVPSTTSMPASA